MVLRKVESRNRERLTPQKMAKEALLLSLTRYYGDGELGLPGTQEEKIQVQLDVVIDIWNKYRTVIGKSYDIMNDFPFLR